MDISDHIRVTSHDRRETEQFKLHREVRYMTEHGIYTLLNVNEKIVKSLALDLMEKSNMCQCEKCLLDVCALVLNRLPGCYVTGRKGELIGSALSGLVENKTEMLVLVARAIEQVQADPHH